MRVVLVANPAARRVDDAGIERCRAAWSAEHELTLLRSRGAATAGELRPLLRDADAVVVLGGDGILNTVAHTMVEAASDAVIVPLPGGTTNVVARSIGLPGRLVDADPVARAALRRGAVARRGVGRLNGRTFVANAGIGFDAAVVARTEAEPGRKRRFGHSWFAASAAAEVLSRHGTRAARLRCDGGVLDGELFWVLALASHPYTYVGRRPIEPLGAARWCDDGRDGGAGSLRLLGVSPTTTRRLVRLASRAILTSRGIEGAPGVFFTQITSTVAITSRDAVKWQIDGEPQPAVSEFTLSWEPAALRLLDAGADRRR